MFSFVTKPSVQCPSPEYFSVLVLNPCLACKELYQSGFVAVLGGPLNLWEMVFVVRPLVFIPEYVAHTCQ